MNIHKWTMPGRPMCRWCGRDLRTIGEDYIAIRGFFCTQACAMDLGSLAAMEPHRLTGPGYKQKAKQQRAKQRREARRHGHARTD
jgi:hypothetical protein